MVTGHGIDMSVRHKISCLLPLMAGLSACAASDARYPSLAMRPFETAPVQPADPPPAPEPTRPAADPQVLAQLVARAEGAQGQFARIEPDAARLARAATGQGVESNTRAAALVAMADLAAQRGATSAVLAELELLEADSAATFAPTNEIVSAQTRVAGLVAGQDAAMARLWEVLGR